MNSSPSPYKFLVPPFISLSRYAIASMQSGPDDARLPKVFEGLILVCEGLSGIGLAVQGRRDRGEVEKGGDEEMVRDMKAEIVNPLIGIVEFPLYASVRLC